MRTVILVDPSAGRDVLAERLEMQGYTVWATSDAAAGAHQALCEPPDAVVADLWMPGISGIQLCRLLKSEPATESVPIVLRGPENGGRDRFWAERAGAVSYVGRGSMGALVRALTSALAAAPPQGGGFFTQLSADLDLRDRIAAQLDAALFDSVIAAEIRALGACGTFDRLFDLLSQFVSQVATYRWLAVYTDRPERFALHTHPALRARAEQEARTLMGVRGEVPVMAVEDEDAASDPEGGEAVLAEIVLGSTPLGTLGLGMRQPSGARPTELHGSPDAELLRVIGRELGGPIRIATLMEDSNRLAMMDSLTGLPNRRAFTAAVVRQAARLERHAEPFCLLLLDVDRFKAINDQRGHPVGDLVLARLGQLLGESVRRTDVVGRWGGEEFVVSWARMEADDALPRAEALRSAIEGLVIQDPAGGLVPVTASIGVASARVGESVEDLVRRADTAMYAAKTAGRNRVMVAPSAAPASPQPDGPTYAS